MTSEAVRGRVGGLPGPRWTRGPVRRVLVFGSVASSTDTLTDGSAVTEVGPDDATTVQLEHRYDAGVISARVWDSSSVERRRALVHNLAAHLRPGGLAVIGAASTCDAEVAQTAGHARACGLEPLPGNGSRAFRRTERVTVHDLLADARSRLVRLRPAELATRLRIDPGCLVLDTRTSSDRAGFGTIPGSRHVPRSTLEWRVDPFSGYSDEGFHDEGFPDAGRCLVVVCNDGYSSSLAADSLQRLGFRNATDLIGGFRAWRAAGLPVVPPSDDRSGAPCVSPGARRA
ncbi:MAG: hypothetical protein HY830_17170 [Actinobacteria bacterium]|nr:hypothetical protein [Actinomycetota bacterium]